MILGIFKKNGSIFEIQYRLVRKSNQLSFLILKRISGNSIEDQYFILPNCSLVIELQFGNIA
jgi:hypothetical protein